MAHEGLQDGENREPDPGDDRSRITRNARYIAAAVVAIVIAVSVFALTRGGDEQETEASLSNLVGDRSSGLNADGDASLDNESVTPTPVVAAEAVSPASPTAVPGGDPQIAPGVAPVAISTAAPPDPTAAPAPTTTPVIGSPTTATPSAATPGPALQLTQAAADFADQIETRHGVRIARISQNWGGSQSDQMRNLTSVAAALQSLPPDVVAEVVGNDGGTLVFLSNNSGSTQAGWQPYGNRAANYYTNEDESPNGRIAANQVVMQTGSTSQTIGHELIHAYQMRDIDPGKYVLALLTDEMKSFMQATGWRQLASDEQIRASSSASWSDVNKFFAYEGRPLNYINEHGVILTLYAPNPMEAYAESAGLYYARSFATPLPDWPEYWAWFDTNLG